MPGATNVPFDHVLDSRKKTFMPADQLKLYLDSHNIKLDKPIISSCGTGVTACILDAALTEIGYPEHMHRVYDGSWTEWAQRVKPEENLIKKK
jgi:thiosulfate/3-mercaptopyruvate sulfurtransferase